MLLRAAFRVVRRKIEVRSESGSGIIFDISTLKLQRSAEMSKKLKMLFRISAILALMLTLPLASEAGRRGHGSSRNHSGNHHNGFRIGVGIRLPNQFYAKSGVYYRYNSHYNSNTYRYNGYRSETQAVWQKGYDDGYGRGYHDAERRSGRYSNKMFSYDRRYSNDRSYRQGYEAGYSEGFRDRLDSGIYGKTRIY